MAKTGEYSRKRKGKKMKGRALFFLNSFYGGGAERVCLDLAAQLHEFHIESDFITIYDSACCDYEIPDYIHIFSLGIPYRHLACVWSIKYIPEINRFISGRNYILITAHLQPSALLASLTRVGKRCLYVMHVTQQLTDHNFFGLYRVILRLFLRGKKIVTVSKGLKDELNVQYRIKKENIAVIYNPCSLKRERTSFNEESLRRRPYILVLGRLEEQKNPLLALDLFYKGEFYYGYDLIYLGKGSLEKDIRDRIAAYRLEKYVFLAGFQRNQEVWIREAALLLSCSKYEGLPMNLIESLVCGTPVVASDCPYGPGEVLIDELKEYLIDPLKKPEESISVIRSALEFYPEITEKYYSRFAPELIVKRYLRIWRRWFG